MDETPATHAGMTPEQLAEAKQYGRYSLACTLADKVLDLLFLTFAAVVLARPLDAWLQGWPLLERFASLRLVVFFLLVTLLHMGVSLPLSFYAGYILEHRFHLSTLSRGRLGATVFEAKPARPRPGHGADSRPVLADLDDPRLVVAGGRRGLFLRHDHHGPNLPGAHHAAVL